MAVKNTILGNLVPALCTFFFWDAVSSSVEVMHKYTFVPLTRFAYTTTFTVCNI